MSARLLATGAIAAMLVSALAGCPRGAGVGAAPAAAACDAAKASAAWKRRELEAAPCTAKLLGIAGNDALALVMLEAHADEAYDLVAELPEPALEDDTLAAYAGYGLVIRGDARVMEKLLARDAAAVGTELTYAYASHLIEHDRGADALALVERTAPAGVFSDEPLAAQYRGLRVAALDATGAVEDRLGFCRQLQDEGFHAEALQCLARHPSGPAWTDAALISLRQLPSIDRAYVATLIAAGLALERHLGNALTCETAPTAPMGSNPGFAPRDPVDVRLLLRLGDSMPTRSPAARCYYQHAAAACVEELARRGKCDDVYAPARYVASLDARDADAFIDQLFLGKRALYLAEHTLDDIKNLRGLFALHVALGNILPLPPPERDHKGARYHVKRARQMWTRLHGRGVSFPEEVYFPPRTPP